jgi:hypothetical protein
MLGSTADRCYCKQLKNRRKVMGVFDVTTVVDGVPYRVQAEPYDFNTEKRFKVSYDGKEYIFAYDSSMGRYAALGDEAVDIPDNLEAVVAERLENYRG